MGIAQRGAAGIAEAVHPVGGGDANGIGDGNDLIETIVLSPGDAAQRVEGLEDG